MSEPGKKLLLSILRQNKGKWISAEDLDSAVAIITDAHVTCPKVRSTIRQLVLDGQPIVSSNVGFKYTTDPTELLDAAEELRDRAAAIYDRAAELMRTAVAVGS